MQQTIFVTGGASGIGLACAEAILAQGWRVVVTDLMEKNLDDARARIGQRDDVRYDRLDVSDEAAVVSSVDRCESEFGPITGVLNSAGIARDVPALETSADLFRKILDVNLVGNFVVAREAARHMRTRGAGSIVNVASVSGMRGNRGRVAYGSSKAGAILMTQVMAVELAQYGIRVNAIAPGPIETPMTSAIHPLETRQEWISKVPQKHYGTPGDIAGAALFLLDPRASGFVTGQVIAVDGGFTAAGLMVA